MPRLSTQDLISQYGKPSQSGAPAPAPTSSPGLSTDELISQYGKPQPKGLFNKIGNFFSSAVSSEKGLGQDLAYKGNNKKYQDALEQHNQLVSSLKFRIAQDQTFGNDTTKLQAALDQLKTPTPQQFSAVKPTGEKVAGDILGTATDAASVIPGVGAAEDVGKGLVKDAAVDAAKTGALFGAGQGASQAMQQNKGVLPTIASTAVGAATGGATGAAVGAVGAKLRDLISPSVESLANKAKNEFKDALDIISPKLTPGEKEAAVSSGKGVKSGLLKSVKLEPEKIDQDAAKVVSGMVKKGKTFVENINTVRQGISDEAERLKTKIGTANHPYTFRELNSKLSNVEKPISIKSDTTLSKQFDLVRSAFMDIAKKAGGDISSLLDARKSFDSLVQKEFPNLYDRENAPMRNAITGIRNAVNDFIEDNLPENVQFKKSLKDQSLMYHAIDNMSTNAKGEIGTNVISRFAKNNPKTATAIGTGASVIGAETLVKKVKDLFSPGN